MNSVPDGRSEQVLLAKIETQLIAAGYSYIVRNSGMKARCDLICYGTLPDGTFAVAAVVEVKASADKQSRDLATPGLLIAKNDFDAEYAFLITPDEIWQASESTLSLERVSVVPQLPKAVGVVRSKRIALDLITRHLETMRGSSDIGIALFSLAANMETHSGVVDWTKPNTQIDSQVFLEAYFELLNKLRGLNQYALATSSSRINSLFSLIARWFPQSTELFDPTAGVGSSLVAASRGVRETAEVKNKTIRALGFEVNTNAHELAMKIGDLLAPELEAKFEKKRLT